MIQGIERGWSRWGGVSSSQGVIRCLPGVVNCRLGSCSQMRMLMHDAYASIYRISMLIFKISQLICTNFLVSMQYMKSQSIKCKGIYIRVCNDMFPVHFMNNPLTNSTHLMHVDWKSSN